MLPTTTTTMLPTTTTTTLSTTTTTLETTVSTTTIKSKKAWKKVWHGSYSVHPYSTILIERITCTTNGVRTLTSGSSSQLRCKCPLWISFWRSRTFHRELQSSEVQSPISNWFKGICAHAQQPECEQQSYPSAQYGKCEHGRIGC